MAEGDFDEWTDDTLIGKGDFPRTYKNQALKCLNVGADERGVVFNECPVNLNNPASSDAESSTTSTAFQQKARLTFTPPTVGNYLIHWTAEVSSNSDKKGIKLRVQKDDTEYISGDGDQLAEGVPATEQKYPCFQIKMGAKRISLDATEHNIDLDYATEGATAYIRNARIWAVRD